MSRSFPIKKTREAMYVERDIEARSCKQCGSGKAISIRYSERVSLSLRFPARNAHGPYCHLWSAPFHNVLPHYLITARVLYKNVIEYTMRV
jgi:hypothetical protein